VKLSTQTLFITSLCQVHMFINKHILFTRHYIPAMDSSIVILHQFFYFILYTTKIALILNSTHMTIKQVVINFLNKAYAVSKPLLLFCSDSVLVIVSFILFIFVTFQLCLQLYHTKSMWELIL
jgi:hypothetical protein